MTESAVAAPVETSGRLEVGERLRAIRLLRRLTLREVAEAAGVSESFVSQLERGRSSASVATLQRLAAAVGIERQPSQLAAVPQFVSAPPPSHVRVAACVNEGARPTAPIAATRKP